MFTIDKLFSEKFIFLKFWYINSIPYISLLFSPLPGGKEGISCSSIGGFNIGINQYSTKINESIVALEYLTSKDIQKKYFAEKNMYSPIPSLYDESLCEKVNCNLFKDIQLIARPTNYSDDYKDYSQKFRKNVYKYLYGNETAINVLRMIEDLTKIYYLELKIEDTLVGLIIFLSCLVIIFIMLLSLLFPFIKKFKLYFNYLSLKSWFITITGCTMILCTSFVNFGLMTVYKCHLKLILSSIGLTLSLAPTLYKLIIQIPLNNKYSKWCKNIKYQFIIFLVMIDIIINSLVFTSHYEVIENKYEKIYQTCKLNKIFGEISLDLLLIYKLILTITMIFLSFIEWNIKSIKYNVQISSFCNYINILSLMLIIIFDRIKIENYILFNIIQCFIYTLISVSNYISLYGFRIIWRIIDKNKSEENQIIKNIINKFSSTSDSSNQKKCSSSTEYNGKISNVKNKILIMHFMTLSENDESTGTVSVEESNNTTILSCK